MNFLPNKKTYIAALGMALLGVFEIVNGNTPAGVQRLVEAFGFIGLRAGIAKAGK
ncbi:hypothetical protein [Desulfopila inferna]|uniref:hypothetical protein n=1 Tax=Desulfopila inferna TaxID=468528 RepID=UPI0019653770|nr:hypothetical protein [Desulfopila inferna]MBM9605952.1 hypothetical protein [Desulfopila inferna]